MDITPLIPEGRKVITSYGNESFTVNKETYTESIIVTPENVMKWQVQTSQDITIESLDHLLNNNEKIEILLIGAGKQHPPIKKEMALQLKKYNIAVDFMSTGAACRTYNVLIAEERDVACALIPI